MAAQRALSMIQPPSGVRLDPVMYCESLLARNSTTGAMSRQPSEYIWENIYMTFQDDVIAFQYIQSMNADRLMWANDFPHPDASWPNSQSLLAEQTKWVTPEQRRKIVCDNAAALYGIDVGRLDFTC